MAHAEPRGSILYDKQGAIASITLNRPEVLNAISLTMRDQLWDIFRAVRDDPDVGVAIITGAGERAFSTGADITEFGTAPSYLAARSARHERDIWGLLLSIQKPIIAAIHGFAYGAGCEMALCCDLRVASEDATFALPEVGLGYIPSAGGTQLLPRTIGYEAALRMILTGDPIDAREALRLGLVTRIVPRTQLSHETRALAHLLLSRPRHALRYAKDAITSGLELTLEQGLRLEGRLARLALAEPGHG